MAVVSVVQAGTRAGAKAGLRRRGFRVVTNYRLADWRRAERASGTFRNPRFAPPFATRRYTRPASAASDRSDIPSFLRTWPDRNPRTECGCQPVAFCIAAMVAPSGRFSSASMVAFLVSVGAEVSPALCASFGLSRIADRRFDLRAV